MGQVVVARHGMNARQKAADGAEVGGTFGHRIKARRIGESVELDDAINPGAMHLTQHLQGGRFLDRGRHQAIIALGIVFGIGCKGVDPLGEARSGHMIPKCFTNNHESFNWKKIRSDCGKGRDGLGASRSNRDVDDRME